MEALKFLLLLCVWYECASAQTTEFSASCSVTVVDDTANVTLNSNVNGTFQCIVDGRDPETCNSGDKFEDLSEGVHSILIQFIAAGLTQPLTCLNQRFTISGTSTSLEFEVKFLYVGNDIILMIDSSNDGIFCCQLDRGTCIHCVSGFQFSDVPSGSHTIMVQGASMITPHLTKSVTLEIPEFTVAADVLGSTITLLISPGTDGAFRCRLDDNEPVACSNGSQFRGVSAGQHIIEVEKINSAEQATASVTVDVSQRVVSFTDMQFNVNQTLQNYTFTFTLSGEQSDMIRFNFFIDSNLSSVPDTCIRIVDTNYSCSFILSESSGVSLGYHNITIQALRDEIVYGEITERFFVLRNPAITFKQSSYKVKEDDERFIVTVQKFGLTTESITVLIRTRASRSTSAIPSTDYPTTPRIVVFEAGSTSEMTVELRVEPDDIFETNETYRLTLFVLGSVRRAQNLTLLDTVPVVTIVNDDNVTVNLRSQVNAVREGGTYVANIAVDPTTLMTSFDVIVQTYFCGGCNGANPGTDYTPVNQTVTLGPANTVEQIIISVLEDIFTESNDEVVCVRTVLPERSQVAGALLNSSDTNFTIIDNNQNSVNLSFFTISTSNQDDIGYNISVHYNATQQASAFNCRLNDQTFSPCDLPQMYSNLPYDMHTVTIQAVSNSVNITIVQKVLMVMGEIAVFNGTAVIPYIWSTLPVTYRCRLNDGEYFSCNDGEVIANLPRGNYSLTVEATSIDNNALMASEVLSPVFLFGPDIVEGQSAAALCSGSASFFSMDVFYTASWRAREDRVDFVLAANTSKRWLAIGFTDKQMMKFDSIVGATNNNGTYFVDDRNAIVSGKLHRDSEQNVENASVLFDNGVTTVRFSRQKNTGDEDDFSLDVCRYFIFSWGEVIDIITGDIVAGQPMGSDVAIRRHRSISDELICLPISTSLCPELFDCGEPGEPLNGTVQVVGDNLEGSVANYACNNGHLLIGESQRTCTSNDSVWTGAVPECQFVDCGHPGTPSNGSSNFISTILDATVTHSCDPGYVLCNGDETRTCQPDMSWSGILPECIRVTVTVSNGANYVVDETDGAVNITLMFDQPSCQSITVIARPQVRLIPDATADDFDNATVIVIADPGETMVTVSIPIIDDDLLESREDFDVVIEIGGTDTDGAVVGQPGVAQVTIVSEDVVMVSFTESEYNETEGAGSMRIEVQLSRVLQQAITIQIATTGITAEGNGIDFDSTIRNVTFSPGNDISFAFIPIIDNNAVEILENFSLSIQIHPEFAEIGVQLGALNMATGFIINDDVDCGSLNNTANGQVSFTETFGGSVANYSCDQGYVLCGAESRTCQSNGSWSGSPPECIRIIVTVDESMPYIVFENESSVSINLLLDRPSCRPITIIANPQEQSPPSATVDDFNDTSVRVTINPGETTATASIMIINDDLLELTELFEVEFSIEGTDTAGAEIGGPRIAQITISNDDDIVAMFTEREYNASEGAGMISIGVELNRESPQNIVLQLSVMPITAEGNGVDIDSDSRNITFERGRRTLNLFIPINDDNIFEQAETVSFSLQVPPDLMMIGVQLGSPSEARGIIFDDEADCGEPESPENGMVIFGRTVEGSVANYTCDEGYILNGVTQRICDEDTQWSEDVPLCQIVNCNSPPMPINGNVFAPSTTFGSIATHTCNAGFLLCGENRTCQSNGSWSGSTPECIRVMVTVQESVTREENLGTANIPLFLDRASCLPITVIAHPRVRSEPDATENDFDNSTVTVVINPGETTATVSIPLIDDDLLELTELFNVDIEIGANGTDYVAVRPPGFSQVQIVNEDLLTVRFTETMYNVSEGEGVMTIGIVLNRPSPQRITIRLVITENSAEGDDLDSQNRDVTFERGSIREFVNISINDDNMVEPTETFRLSFRITQAMRRMGISTTIIGDMATGIITDDDVDCGSLENPDNGQVEISSEGSVADYTCNRRHVLCGTDSRVCQSNGSWSGSPPQCIRAIVTVDDSVDYTIDEDGGSVNIIILLDQPSCQMITIIANPQVRSPPSATANDFNTTAVRVTINPGENSTVVPIGIIDDDLLEDMEHFDVAFSTSSNIGAVMRQPRVAEVTIASEDVAFVSFTQQQYYVSEDAGSMVVGVQLNREVQQRIAVQVRLTENSAEGNEIDFRSNGINVAFQRGVVIQNVSIPIINDDIVEMMENFSLSFQILQRFSSIGVRQGTPATATGFIIDDDVDCGDPGQPANGNVSFVTTREGGVANYTCNEGYNLTGVTQRICQSNGSWSGDIPTCQIVDCGPLGTPTNGMSVVNTTTFGSVAEHNCLDGFLLCGSQSRTCQASGLWSGSLPDCIMVTVTLEDTTYQVSEDNGFVEIKLLLDQPACVSISIVVQPEIHMFGDPGNIASEDDFNISSTVAVFNPGEMESAVFISVINDLILEQDELFDIVLIDSNDTGIKVGMPRTAEVTIMNSNMLTVAFSQEVYSVNESDGQVTVALGLSRPAGQNVTIGVRAIPNTAQGNNLDFDSMRKTVIFGPNDTLSFLDIFINNDAELELGENFTLSIQLSRVTVRIGVGLGDPSETVVVINDDDEAISVEFEQSSYMVNEKAGHIEICLLSSGQNNADITVMVQPQEAVPVSARASSDFQNTVSIIRFGPGEVISCYNQTIVDDTVPEFLETFDLVILANSVIMAGNQSTSQITIIDDDIKGNDTIIGDPVYTVPLQISPEMMAANPNTANLSLCYEIHGRANSFFNLVSDRCVSITAEYLQSVNNSRLNVIGTIGVLAVDNNGDCQRITVDGNGCVASVGATAVTPAAPYNNSGIRVRMNRRHYRIAVPNCELQDLVVWAICEDQNSLKFVITRGFNLQPTSHGLVAQFWNIPVELSSFTGPTPNNETGYYTVKVTPADGDVREFIGSLYPLTWDYTETPCLYAGNQQGGNAIEFKDFSDSVIEGLYSQYTVNSLFGTEFVFSQFDNSQCIP